jgi:hypothetical protein
VSGSTMSCAAALNELAAKNHNQLRSTLTRICEAFPRGNRNWHSQPLVPSKAGKVRRSICCPEMQSPRMVKKL